MDERHMAILSGGGGTNTLAGGTYTVRQGRQGQMSGVDPRLVDILQTAAAVAPPSIGTVEAFSGKTGRSTGTTNHPAGRATDVQIYGPNGEAYSRYVGNPFGAKAKDQAASYQAYEQFAQVARQVQQQKYPELDGAFRWGGYFKSGVNPGDLMHFDLSGGRSAKTPPQTEAWANGIGNGVTRGAAALTEPVVLPGAPQDAQSAIASLIAPTGGTQAPEPPTAAMGFAPTIPDASFGAAPVQMAAASPSPPMDLPPLWAADGGFPDERGQGTDTMVGGTLPPMPRLRDQATLEQQRADQLDAALFGAGPHRGDFARARPADMFQINAVAGAPDASAVPNPTPSPIAPAVGGPSDRRPQPPSPNLRPEGRYVAGAGGAPDAATVPNPPPRGTPSVVSFPALYGEQPGATNIAVGFPVAYGEQPQSLLGGMSAAMGDAPSRTGDLSAAMGGLPSRTGDMSAAMGGPPAPPDPFADFGTLNLAKSRLMGQTIADANYYRPQNIMAPPSPPETATMGERFSAASAQPNADQMFGLPDMNGASFSAPPAPVGTAQAGSTTGEFFTPAPPMPQPGPDPMAGRFNDAFSPGGPGMIADLQGAFNRQQQTPQPAMAQDGINSVFGAPPAAAMPPNLAIPFNEVPGFMGAAPAEASTAAMPSMGMGAFNDRFSPAMPAPQPISMGEFDQRFAGGTAVRPPTPVPGTPGVVQGVMPGAMDIRSPAQGGPPQPPQALPQAQPSQAPRQTNVGAERQRNGTIGRILGGLLGGPVGALGGGLLGGGGGMFGGGSVTPMGASFSSPYMQSNGQMGSTNVQRIQSGNMQGTAWNRNGGGSVGYVTDPFTGSMIYTSSGTTY